MKPSIPVQRGERASVFGEPLCSLLQRFPVTLFALSLGETLASLYSTAFLVQLDEFAQPRGSSGPSPHSYRLRAQTVPQFTPLYNMVAALGVLRAGD